MHNIYYYNNNYVQCEYYNYNMYLVRGHGENV